VEANGNYDSTLTTTDGGANLGVLRMGSSVSYRSAQITFNGTFTNAAAGIIESTADSGGGRYLRGGHLVNKGTVTVDANAYLDIRGTYEEAGGIVGGNAYFVDSTFTESASPASDLTLRMYGTNTLTSDNLAHVTLLLQSDSNYDTSLTSGAGFTNAGTIRLDSSVYYRTSTLAVSAGTLTNAQGGLIDVVADGGGGHTIAAELANLGTVNIATPTSLGTSSANHFNSGLINVVGASLSVTGASFTNRAGGVFAGTGTLDMGGGTFVNAGTVSPAGDGNTGTLNINGNYQQTSTGTLNLDLAGTIPDSEFDLLVVSGTATLDGALAVTLDSGFEPRYRDTYQFLSAGSIAGQFASYTGLILQNSLVLSPQFTAAAVTLQVVALPSNAPLAVDLATGPNQLTVTFFDAAGIDPVSAADPSNYKLISSGPDGTLGDPDDVDVTSQITSITFDATSNQTTLTLNPLPLDSQLYRLTISGVKDLQGRAMASPANYDFAGYATQVNIDVWKSQKGGDWNDPRNWYLGRVPGPNDTVLIPMAGIKVTHASGDATIQSLASAADLVLSGGSLTLTQAASTISGALTVSNQATITASSGATLTQSGPATLTDANLYASAGGSLPFTGAASYTSTAGSGTTIQASDPNSVISLPTMTSLHGGSMYSQLYVNAYNGGRVDLSGVTSYAGGSTVFTSDGTGTTVDLSAMPSLFSDSYYGSCLTVRNGGTIRSGALTTLDRVNVSIADTGALDTKQLTTLTNGSLNVSGPTPDFSTLANVTDSNLYVDSGGTLALPALTTYTPKSGNGVTFQASGTGSVLDLSKLTALHGVTYYSQLYINAYSGGQVKLQNVASYTGGSTAVQASGAGSSVDLSALPTFFSDAYYQSGLNANNGGAIHTGALTTLDRVAVTVADTATLDTKQITTATHGSLTASGSMPDFSSLTDATDTSLYVDSGGHLSLPAVAKTISASGNGVTYQAYGTGSVLDLSHLTALHGVSYYSQLYINAYNGGLVELPNVASYTGGSTAVRSDGTGSVVDLSALPNLTSDAYHWSGLEVSNGGVIHTGALTTLDRVAVDINGTGQLDTKQIMAATRGSLTASGSTPDFSSLIAATDTSLYADSGGQLSLPAVEKTISTAGNGVTYQANGAGSVLDLTHLVSLHGVSSFGQLNINAYNGGFVALSNVTSYTGGSTAVRADGTGSAIDLSARPNLSSDVYYLSGLEVSNGGIIHTGALTTLDRVAVNINGTGQLDTAQLATATRSSLTASGSTPNFSLLTNAANTSLYVDSGGTLALPALTQYLPTTGDSATFQANGAGSVLDLTHLTSLHGVGSFGQLYINAYNTGLVEMPNVTSYTGGSTAVTADGTGSVVDLSGLPSITSDSYYWSSFRASNHGTIHAGQLASINRTSITLSGTGVLDMPALATATNAGFYADCGANFSLAALTSYTSTGESMTVQANGAGSAVACPALTTLHGGASFGVLYVNAYNGANVDLSKVTNYTGGATQVNADGNGSSIALTGLTSLSSDAYYNSALTATNQGNIALNAGTTHLTRVDARVDSGGTITGGTVALDGGATLSGTSTVQANVLNAGQVSPGGNGAGLLTIAGNYTQTLAGALNIQVGGSNAGSQYDQLAVTGTADLHGAINLGLNNGYFPGLNGAFKVLTSNVVTGGFNSLSGEAAGALFFNVVLHSADVTLLALLTRDLRITAQSPAAYTNVALTFLTLTLSDVVAGDSARNAASYVLTDQTTGQTISVTPAYTDGSTTITLNFPALAEGVYALTVHSGTNGLHGTDGRALDGNGTGIGGADYVSTFTVDLTPPVVSAVTLQPSTLTVTFKEAVGMDPATVTRLANYSLIASGGDGIFGNGNDVDVSSHITGVTYDPTTETATLSLSPALGDEIYQVTVRAGVHDLAGNALGGGHDSVTVVTLGAVPAHSSIVLEAASDSGVSHSDGITNVTTPTFDVTVNKAGQIQVDFGGGNVSTLNVTGAGIYPFTAPKLSDGTYTITATFTPLTGSAAQASTSVTILTQAPQLLAGAPSEQAPLYSRTIRFSHAIDPTTLTAALLTLTGPGITNPLAASAVTGSADTYTVSFPVLVPPGQYTLHLAAGVADVAGNVMGAADNPFTLLADVTPPTVTGFTPSGPRNKDVSSVQVTFSEAILTATFTAANITVTGPAGTVDPTTISVTLLSDRSFQVKFANQSANGSYAVTIGTAVTDLAGNALAAPFTGSFTIDKVGPRVPAVTPTGTATGLVTAIDVTFSKQIDVTTLGTSTVTLTGPAGVVPLGTPFLLSGMTYRIPLSGLNVNGSYALAIGPNVADQLGNLMDQNQDGVNGEPSNDVFNRTFTVALPVLAVDTVTPQTAPGVFGSSFSLSYVVHNTGQSALPNNWTDQVYVSATGALDSTAVLLTTYDGGGNRPLLAPDQSQTVALTFTLPYDGNQVTGSYYFIVKTDVTAAIPQATGGVPVAASGAVMIKDTTPPAVVLFSPMGLGNKDISTLQVTFSKRIRGNTFTPSQVTITGPNGTIDSSTITVTLLNDRNFRIDLPKQSVQGTYIVTLGTGIMDLSGNALPAPYQATFTIDKTGPRVTAVTPTGTVNSVVSSVDVTFSKFINPANTAAAISLTDPHGAAVSVSDLSLVSGTTYRFTFAAQNINGSYQLAIGPNVYDLAGNPMDQNQDGVNGEPANDIFHATFSVALPALVVDTITPQASPAVFGDPFSFSYVVHNAGAIAVPASWTDQVYLSKSAVLDASAVPLTTYDGGGNRPLLAPGDAQSVSLLVTLPFDETQTAGNYYLIVKADSTSVVTEADNAVPVAASASFAIARPPLPDLATSNVQGPNLTIADPASVTISWTVSNIGEGPGKVDHWVDEVILSKNATPGASDDIVLGRYPHTGLLDVNQGYTQQQTIKLPPGFTGHFHLFVKTDADNVVFEGGRKANNVAAMNGFFDVMPVPYADLVIPNVTVPAAAHGGQPLTVSWTVENQGIGTTNIGDWIDTVYLVHQPGWHRQNRRHADHLRALWLPGRQWQLPADGAAGRAERPVRQHLRRGHDRRTVRVHLHHQRHDGLGSRPGDAVSHAGPCRLLRPGADQRPGGDAHRCQLDRRQPGPGDGRWFVGGPGLSPGGGEPECPGRRAGAVHHQRPAPRRSDVQPDVSGEPAGPHQRRVYGLRHD
jgi:hypothetical protein